MTALTLSAFATEFHGTPVNILDHAGRKWLTAADVGRCLGYAVDEARNSINRLFSRHADEFTDEDTATVKLTANPQGGNPNTRIFSATGCVKLGFFANTTLAKAFRAWAAKVLAAHIESAPRASAPNILPPKITRAIELEVFHLFVAGVGQKAIGLQLGISRCAVNLLLHGRYRFAPGAGENLTTPELCEAVAARHLQADLERITQKYCASAVNFDMEYALDDLGQRLLSNLPA